MNSIFEYFKTGEEFEISDLIKKVYDEFVAPDYTPDGNAFFYAFIKPETIVMRQEIQNNILLAYADDILAGTPARTELNLCKRLKARSNPCEIFASHRTARIKGIPESEVIAHKSQRLYAAAERNGDGLTGNDASCRDKSQIQSRTLP